MEAAVGTAVGKIAPKLLDLFVSNRKLRKELEHDINYIKTEFLMICAAMREDENRRHKSGDLGGGDVQRAWIQVVRDLSHAIEDCIDRFTHRVMLKTDASLIRRKLHRVKTVSARNEFAAAIRRLRKKLKEASELRSRYSSELIRCCGGNGGTGSSTTEPGASEEETETDTCAAVGMETPLDEVMELMQGQPKNLKVIFLVGFGGIGKTRLARHVYESPALLGQYQARAWVRAGQKSAGVVLQEILRQITGGGSEGGSQNIRKSLIDCLGTQRFLIVIDDMRDEFWHQIKDAFPVVPGVSSRIMVTTAIRSVANACSSVHGQAYMMRTLAQEHSRQLFFREAFLEDQSQLRTSEALTKCDGLPLALVTTAQFLQNGGPGKWEELCENLGKHLETKKTLARLKRVLVRSYTSLGSQDVKTCLLYMGIYPSGRPIRKGSLIRRWLAEGLIHGDHNQSAIKAAISNFDELVNQSIIQPIDVSSGKNRAEVKACQTHGMMNEFILQKSICENFVTLLHDEAPLHSNIRWLSLHHRSAERARMDPKDLPIVRSLTVFGTAHTSMLDFSKYKLLRVLDLEECRNDLEEKHLKKICNLVLLRYLSLGASVTATVLPKEIKKLQLLETLDVRRTNIQILPTQVMKLPCLIHLFGRFTLQHNVGGRAMRKLQTFLSNKSKLETVTGFVLDDKSQGFAQLVEHMKHLTKMKIWCKFIADASSNSSRLSEAIKGFTMRGTDSKASFLSTQVNSSQIKSLSLNFDDEWSHDMLMKLSLEEEKDSSYFLSSLKLQGGNICSLPPFVTVLGGLTKLCLSSPHLQLSSDILASLSSMLYLEYLKLIAIQLEKLVIKHGGFKTLRHLCIVVEVMAELDIEDKALPVLESLRLLCKDQNRFCSTMIGSLLSLKEVALSDGVNDQTKQEWKEAAKNHPRHPKLLFVETKVMGCQPAVKMIPAATSADTTAEVVAVESVLDVEISPAARATDTTIEEVDVESEPAGNINHAASPTTMTLSVTTPPDAISTGKPVQNYGDGQHDDNDDDDDGEKEDMDNIKDTKDIADTKVMGCQPAVKIIPAATSGDTAEVVAGESILDVEISHAARATDTTIEEVDVESEPAAKINHAASPTTMTLSVTTPPDAISTGKPVQNYGDGQHDDNDDDDDGEKEDMDNIKDPKDFADTKVMGCQPAVKMIPSATSADTKAEVFAVESVLDVEISPAARATDMKIKEVDVESEPAAKINHATSLTTMTLSVTMPPDAFSTGKPVQNYGDGQHDDNDDDDDGEKEDEDNIKDPKDFAVKNGFHGQNVHHMNKKRSIEVTEGEKSLQGQKMEDGTLKRSLRNKQKLAWFSSLLAFGRFRRSS